MTESSSLPVAVIRSVEWDHYVQINGSARGVGWRLEQLLGSRDFAEASEAWRFIEDFVFSQGTIYSSAEPTVAVMMAALTVDQPAWRSGRILDLLFYILNGSSDDDPDLQSRCHSQASKGYWLLARWAKEHAGWEREGALAVMEQIDPVLTRELRPAL